MTVYSATQFFNELDLLEIRLETMWDYVDFFVISESTKTHSGKDKPLYYKENKERFEKYRHKIIHQIIDDTPSSIRELDTIFSETKEEIKRRAIHNIYDADWFDKSIESYLRDTYEKEMLLCGLSGANSKDIVLLGDLDEIVRPSSLKFLLNIFGGEDIYHFENEMFYYYFNLQKINEPWKGAFALSFENLLDNSFCKIRTNKKGNTIKDGGWHFTYMGGLNQIRNKINSWGEQSLNTTTTHSNLEERFNNFEQGFDLFGRPSTFVVRDINDGTFPEYIVKNKIRFVKDIYHEDI